MRRRRGSLSRFPKILTSSHGRGCCCCHPTPTHKSPFCGRHDHLRKTKHMIPIQHPILPCGESAQSLPQALVLVQRCDHGLPAAAGLLGVPMQLQRWSEAFIGITVARADGWSASTAPCRPGGLTKWATGVRAPTITVGLSGSWAASTAVEVHTMSLPVLFPMSVPGASGGGGQDGR